MANIDNMVECGNKLMVEAQLLVRNSEELYERLRVLQRASTIDAQYGLKINLDLCDTNQLLGQIYGTADVMTSMNTVFGVLIETTRKMIDDANAIKRRCGRKRRRVSDVDSDADDDDIAFILEQKRGE